MNVDSCGVNSTCSNSEVVTPRNICTVDGETNNCDRFVDVMDVDFSDLSIVFMDQFDQLKKNVRGRR